MCLLSYFRSDLPPRQILNLLLDGPSSLSLGRPFEVNLRTPSSTGSRFITNLIKMLRQSTKTFLTITVCPFFRLLFRY